LTAPYVMLGQAFKGPLQLLDPSISQPFGLLNGATFHAKPTHGPGSLTVRASLIDIGNLSLQNIGVARLIADNGDIRGDGTLDIAGKLFLRAGQIYPVTGSTFTLAASDYRVDGHKKGDPKVPLGEQKLRDGIVEIAAAGARQLPLSAGGVLNIYATRILQGGVLRAPLGSINLGWDGSGVAPVDPITGSGFATAQRLKLRDGSTTSISAVDPVTGREMIIPYGLVANGTSWIDPSGMDITGGGLPAKDIRLSARNLVTEKGSTLDISGGGNFYAYRWATGLSGTRDILASTNSFAVIPGYEADYAPFAPFNQTPAALANFGTDTGYVNGGLSVGDRVYLNGTGDLPAGSYTLLPAHYALLPGAMLVTPRSATPRDTLLMPDGSTLVSGYRYNSLNTARVQPDVLSQFEVINATVLGQRAEYDDYYANSFLRQSARALGVTVPRVPMDSGHLVFEAGKTLRLQGAVAAQPSRSGIGAYIDISSPADIVIAGSRAKLASAKKQDDVLVLHAADLTSFGAESLLIGGIRNTTADGTTVDVKTGNITVDNAGSPLSAPELILVANKQLTVGNGAEISQIGSMGDDAQTLLINGDGELLRVSSDSNARSIRTGVTAATDAKMTIGRNARISGTSLTLDSSYATSLDPHAHLLGDFVSLNSGQISVQLNGAGNLQPTVGLVLAGAALRDLQGVESLSLLSYTTIDIYGSGKLNIDGSLALHAAAIRGFFAADSRVTFSAGDITLDNGARGTAPASIAPSGGTLAFQADTINLGSGRLDIEQFQNIALGASDHVHLTGSGRFAAHGDLTVTTPYIDAENSANHRILADGSITLSGSRSAADAVPANPGLGATLSLEATRIAANTDVYMPSGLLSLHATDGDVTVGGKLDVSGQERTFNDLVKYTDGGRIDLLADNGSVSLARSSTISVAAATGGGNAGTFAISTPKGDFTLAGELLGKGGKGGRDGSFVLDAGRFDRLNALNAQLNTADFTESRNIRVHDGDVTIGGEILSHQFRLSADSGSITVDGTIDASGLRGGRIELSSSGSLVLTSDARLTVAAKTFDAAGKGGAISLEAGSEINGIVDTNALLDLRSGAEIDLGVAANNENSATVGRYTGTLHLRAPQTAGNADLQMAPINATIKNASSIVVEGYQLFDLQTSGVITRAGSTQAQGGAITSAGVNVQGSVKANGALFLGAGYNAMHDRLLANNAGLENVLSIRPGAEVINRTGDLTLGTTASNGAFDWSFDTYRFGPKNAPGVLTLRAAGNIVLFNSLQDGFAITSATSAFTARLMPSNPLLPINAQSWSFRLSAGADPGSADFRGVQPIGQLADTKGSLLLGKNAVLATAGSGRDGTTTSALGAGGRFYQVIRTGSGDIDIAAGRDVRFQNQFASIYTSGTLVDDPTMGGQFDVPILSDIGSDSDLLGGSQQKYPAQYSLAGGNISIAAQGSIYHLTRLNGATSDIEDSSRQLPINWLLHRGYVDAATGEFGIASFGDAASTTWWVNFSNFFEGVGALGGGNVSLTAGRDVRNVDASAVTNARMPEGFPDAAKLIELGGGDVTVNAGNNISGGVYYTERGDIALSAGRSITTNSTRSPSLTIFQDEAPLPEQTWLPTTLFLGKGMASVSALGDVLLGPVVNTFLMPGGFTNTYWYKSYFSTYAADTSVSVRSTGGSVTLREATSLVSETGAAPILLTWLKNVMLLNETNASYYHPWIRLNESLADSFGTAVALLPPKLDVTAITGDINLVGDIVLAPATRGNIDLAAGGSINALQPTGIRRSNNSNLVQWGYSTVNLSDASPGAIPQIASPFAYQSLVGTVQSANQSGANFLSFFDSLFQETGSLNTVLQTKQTLHGNDLLHADDPNPLHLYALDGDISGLSVFSGKSARIVAGRDITDATFYLQNVSADDISVVAAGRDILPYNANSALRTAAVAAGNVINDGGDPRAGDIQISGPGT
ncbi:MAG: beta strand repeat-containing protein, partial [Chthoniobacterales bacterium]